MTEITKGLFVEDYKNLDVFALEEIIRLDEQLDNNLQKIREFILDADYPKALVNLRLLIEDNLSHKDYCSKCQDDIFDDMQCTEDAEHFEDYMNEPE